MLQNVPYYAPIMLHCDPLCSIKTWLTALLEYVTVLLEYLDFSISVAGHSKDLEGLAPPLAMPLKKKHGVTKFRDLHLYNMPIMPALCTKLAYYASMMLDASACLLCLKLCQHNRCRPKSYTVHYQSHWSKDHMLNNSDKTIFP